MKNIEYLIQKGWKPTRETHDELIGCCPAYNHQDKNPSFSINKKTGYFNCHSCNCKGKALITLKHYVENIPIEELKKNNKIKYKSKFNEDINKYYMQDNKVVDSYLEKRGYKNPAKIRKRYRIGYVSNKSVQKIIQKYGMEYLRKKKHMQNIRYLPSGRISIPIYWQRNIVGFSFRSLSSDKPKYLTIAQRKKMHWFYGAIGTETIICEGVFDCIALTQCGYNSVALIGTDMSPERATNLTCPKITLCLDGDRPGYEATLKIFELLGNKKEINIMCLPKNKDIEECKEDISKIYNSKKTASEFLVSNAKTFSEIQNIYKTIKSFDEPQRSLYEVYANKALKRWLAERMSSVSLDVMIKAGVPDCPIHLSKVIRKWLLDHHAISID